VSLGNNKYRLAERDDTPQAQMTALTELVQSDGWRILSDLVNETYSADACLAEIDHAMTELRPGDDERAVVTQIRAAFKAARVVLELPHSRIRTLKAGEKHERKTIADRFTDLRASFGVRR
jgi:hypothetical protein